MMRKPASGLRKTRDQLSVLIDGREINEEMLFSRLIHIPVRMVDYKSIAGSNSNLLNVSKIEKVARLLNRMSLLFRRGPCEWHDNLLADSAFPARTCERCLTIELIS